MTRLAISVAVAASTLLLAAPSLAADYFGSDAPLRTGFANEDGSDLDNPLTFELGLRYWYSWGQQKADFGNGELNSNDRASIVEAHLRIDDYSTQSYVKGLAGYSAVINGDYQIGGATGGPIESGRVAYAGADFGWSPFGWAPAGNGIYGFVGYQYWNDSPEMGRGPFVVSLDGAGNPNAFNSAVNNLDINALRLGLAGRMDFGMFDVTAEVAAIPYAWMSGTLGTGSIAPFNYGGINYYQASSTNISGFGYGAMGELMVGFKPVENMAIRAGGRAWYVGGNLDYTYDAVSTAGHQGFIGKSWVSAFRYGLLAEMTYKF